MRFGRVAGAPNVLECCFIWARLHGAHEVKRSRPRRRLRRCRPGLPIAAVCQLCPSARLPWPALASQLTRPLTARSAPVAAGTRTPRATFSARRLFVKRRARNMHAHGDAGPAARGRPRRGDGRRRGSLDRGAGGDWIVPHLTDYGAGLGGVLQTEAGRRFPMVCRPHVRVLDAPCSLFRTLSRRHGARSPTETRTSNGQPQHTLWAGLDASSFSF